MASRQDLSWSDEKPVVVMEANPATRHFLVKDNFGSQFMVQTSWEDPFIRVPMLNENWTVYRKGTNWFFNKRIDDGSEHKSFESLAPGDARIEYDENLWINGIPYDPLVSTTSWCLGLMTDSVDTLLGLESGGSDTWPVVVLNTNNSSIFTLGDTDTEDVGIILQRNGMYKVLFQAQLFDGSGDDTTVGTSGSVTIGPRIDQSDVPPHGANPFGFIVAGPSTFNPAWPYNQVSTDTGFISSTYLITGRAGITSILMDSNNSSDSTVQCAAGIYIEYVSGYNTDFPEWT